MNKSSKLLVGLASLTLTDIAVADAAEPYTWAGFYAGAHAGYRRGDADFSAPGSPASNPSAPPRSEHYKPEGTIVGIQAGYNHMATPMILAGIEGDMSWGSGKATASGTSIDNLGDGFSFASRVELGWQATIRARLGVVNGPWLGYVTGGAAFTRARWVDSTTQIFVGSPQGTSSWDFSKTVTGLVVGVGAEYMFAPQWIARLEYLHENFGDVIVPFGFGTPRFSTLSLDVDKLRVAVSYKFRP